MTGTDPVYLDHNATTPIPDPVREAMIPFLDEAFGNPSSSHAYGDAPADAVARAREALADLLGAQPREVVFTSGGTEANNWVLREAPRARADRSDVVTTEVEHPSVGAAAHRLAARTPAQVTRIEVDGDGRVDADHVVAGVDGDTALASVMLAQNEVGTLQPVAAIAEALPDDVWLHTDASQAVGKIPVDVADLGVDLLTVAGHKLGAPKGIGALYVRDGLDLPPLVLGADQEAGRRAGTEPVPAVAGLGAAAELAGRRGDAAPEHLARTRDRLRETLVEELGADALLFNTPDEGALPNTLNVSFPGLEGPTLLERADGVAASSGSACHDETADPSDVLLAMGRTREEAIGAVRLSTGHATGLDEVEAAARTLAETAREMGFEGTA
jgi:cysteine desulfurase